MKRFGQSKTDQWIRRCYNKCADFRESWDFQRSAIGYMLVVILRMKLLRIWGTPLHFQKSSKNFKIEFVGNWTNILISQELPWFIKSVRVIHFSCSNSKNIRFQDASRAYSQITASNSYLKMTNGLQSGFRPFEPSNNTKNKTIICQSIFSLLNFTTHAMRQTLTPRSNND